MNVFIREWGENKIIWNISLQSLHISVIARQSSLPVIARDKAQKQSQKRFRNLCYGRQCSLFVSVFLQWCCFCFCLLLDLRNPKKLSLKAHTTWAMERRLLLRRAGHYYRQNGLRWKRQELMLRAIQRLKTFN